MNEVDNTKYSFLTIGVVHMQKVDLKPLAKRIGQAVAAERLKKGFTQESLAEKLDVDKETISRFERGVVLPPLPRLAQLADVLGVPLTNLIRRTSARPTDQAQLLGEYLDGLTPADREMVTRWFTEVCQRLTAKPETSGSKR